MKNFIAKNSKAYFVLIALLLIGAFVGTNGFQWYQWVMIAVAVAMAVYYLKNRIQS